MAAKKAIKEPNPLPVPPDTVAASQEAAANNDVKVPADSRAVLVLGINADGNLFNHLGGTRLGLVEFAGLLNYGQRILDSLWNRSTAAGQDQ